MCMVAGLIACTSENFTPQEETTASVPMQFDIKVADNAETKATKTEWANGDKIYVFFNGLATKYLILEYNGSTWSNTSGGEDLLNTDFESLGTKTLTAVHFPVAVNVAFADNQFSFTKDSKPVYNYYLFQAGKSYEVSGTTVSATLSMGKPDGMAQFHVAGIQDNVSNYTFGCSKVKPVACTSVGTDGTINVDVLQAGARLSGIADSDGAIFAGRLVYPGLEKNYVFTVASDDNIYTLTRTRFLTAGNMYNFPALPSTSDANWTVTAASSLYVNMGLSVYWAKYNVGATTETDFGDYFAWGETTGYKEGKTTFTFNNYIWGTSNNVPNTLSLKDDAAYVALGGKFRMPTLSEMNELVGTQYSDNYTWTWCDGSTTKYNGTDVQGWKIERKSTHATLFLPAGGGWDESGYYYSDLGRFWSSTTSSGETKSLVISTGNLYVSGISYRCWGQSVRPVSSR